jgi:phosphatidylinositol-3-phosphatase
MMNTPRTPRLALAAAAVLLAGVTGTAMGVTPPRYDHIVIVIEENHDGSAVMADPWFAGLGRQGAVMTDFHGITHPSQPNYFALFSGSTQGVTDDGDHDLSAPNLALSLRGAGLGFAGYCEDLPAVGSRISRAGSYVRKHNPVASFTNVPAVMNRPFSDFPADYALLPTVSLVVPNMQHDMHDGSVREAGAWLEANIAAYGSWALSHNSLLVVTFDESSARSNPVTTPIAAILVGARILAGATSSEPANIYSLLRLVLEIYGLVPLGNAATATRINGLWT